MLGAPSAVVLPTNPPNVSMLRQFCECYFDLSGLILCPVLGSIILLFIPNSRIRLIRFIGLCVSLLTFLYSLVLWMQFDSSTAEFQFVGTIRWLPHENINLYMGLDGISLFFVVLTTFLIPICILVGWSSIESYGKEYVIVFLICEFLMIAVFCMLDLLLFYVFFESVLIPMLCGAEHLLFAGSWSPLQEPCAVNPLGRSPAKLSGRRVVLCVGIAFPNRHPSMSWDRGVLRVVGTSHAPPT